MRNLMVASRIAITTIARKHKDVTFMTKLHGSQNRYAVGYAAIEHRNAVHRHYLADKGQRTGCTHRINGTLTV